MESIDIIKQPQVYVSGYENISKETQHGKKLCGKYNQHHRMSLKKGNAF